MRTKTIDSFVAAGLAALAIFLAALAIWGDDSGSARGPAGPAASFQIVYERSGGFAPSTSKLVVRPGFRAVAATGGTRAGERTVRFRIGEGRIAALERGLRRAHFARLESAAEITCADCYFYAISYRGHRVRLDEAHVPPRLAPVLGELESIVTVHAIPPNA